MNAEKINAKLHARCMETLANRLRLDIIKLLAHRPMNVNEIAAATKAERSRVSHALQRLRKCQFVHAKKEGREQVYSLDGSTPFFKGHDGDIFALIQEHVRTNCASCLKHGRT
jgi:DNA-binding transcriptional ArsR family regulator